MVGFVSKKSMAEERWIITLEQDAEDLILPLPEEFMLGAGWQTGDTIEWVDKKDGTWQLINTRILNDGLMNQNPTV